MEPNQVDVVTAAVLRCLEQVIYTAETRFAREVVSNVGDTNRDDRIHHDLALVHPVATTRLHVRPRPDTDAAPNPPAPNSFAKAFTEDHDERFHLSCKAIRAASEASF